MFLVCPSDVCLSVAKKMSTLSETGQFMSSILTTYESEIVASTCLMNESVLQEAEKNKNFLLYLTLLTLRSKSRRSQFGL